MMAMTIMIMLMVVTFVQRGEFSFPRSGRKSESLSEITLVQKNINHLSFTVQDHNFASVRVFVCIYIYTHTHKTTLSTIHSDKVFQILNGVLKSLKSTVHAILGPTHFTFSCPAVLIV